MRDLRLTSSNLAEQFPCKEKVLGSNPRLGSYFPFSKIEISPEASHRSMTAGQREQPMGINLEVRFQL